MPDAEAADRIERVLVVHAHPDDLEFTCGGTVARMSAEGIEVNSVICTEGNRGGEGDRRFRPNLVTCPNPVRHFGLIHGNHPDHLAAGEATFAALYPTARNPMALPELLRDEGLQKWVVDWVYVGGQLERNHFEDITSTVDRKVEALACHKSQLPPEVGGWVKYRDKETAAEAREKGLGDFEYAEGFRKLWTGEIRRPEDVARMAAEEGVKT